MQLQGLTGDVQQVFGGYNKIQNQNKSGKTEKNWVNYQEGFLINVHDGTTERCQEG